MSRLVATGAEDSAPPISNRYFGTWQGTWLEGMSSGKIQLEIKESSGQMAFTALPSFGTAAVVLSKLSGTDRRLSFQTSGADGRTMRFDLKPTADFTKLKGKAHYDSLHMELELTRAP